MPHSDLPTLRLTDSQSYIYPDKTILSLNVTLNQWAEFVSSMGNGMGTPCTLHYRPVSNEIKQCESPELPSKFEFRNDARINEFKEMTNKISTIVEGVNDSKLTKSHKEDINRQLNQLKMMLNENFEYYRQIIREDMEDVVLDAKKNLESYAERIGINNIPQIANTINVIEIQQKDE